MIVLGIDPGSRRCGYGVVVRREGRLLVLASGVISPGGVPMPERLARIQDGLADVIRRVRPAEVSIEQVFAGASARSALVLGQARGVALAAAARAGLPVFEYAPSQVKLAFTGSGRAGKDQMLRSARLLLGAAPTRADEADALAIAVCHLARRAARSARPARVDPVPSARPVASAGDVARVAPVRPARAVAPGADGSGGAGEGARRAAALARLRPARRDHRGTP